MEKKKQVVAFLGPNASYTHQATTNFFPASDYTIIPQTTIDDVFAAVQHDKAAYGVVPFENSSNGSVIFTLDLFADAHGRHPDILVCAEIYLPVHHCLLGYTSNPATASYDAPSKADVATRILPTTPSTSPSLSGTVTPTQATPTPSHPRVKPSHDLKHITKLYSHPQAWGQCKLFLSTYLKNVERQDVSSTSKAAEFVAQDETRTSAAISSKIAADVNGLSVLAEGIEDSEGNCTRFFVLRKGEDAAPVAGGGESGDVDGEGEENGGWKSLVAFTVDHGSAGALADCLGVFKRLGLNLTSINTRPSGNAAWHYIFFVEFMGRKRAEEKGGAVNEALEELTKVAKSWRWLGSWKNALKE